ncbi:MAG TPA: carbohydrate ABC transporter permease [Thermomicrobiales bacterium]|jgi:multiple sugar transport system permease protein/putative chitobiose transport system permease protein|nr:carbohydrate ABC transporter permease [Thermomicrobiales bacterium]
MDHTESQRFRPSQLWTYLALVILAIIVLLPLEWIIASSFTNRETVFKNVLPFSLKALYPENPTLQGYRAIFNDGYGRAIVNTLGVAITTVLGCLFVGTTAGFAFARFDFRFKGLLWSLVLLSLMVPYEATVIPAYTMINNLGWTNSWQALIVPALANGTVIFLFRQFFAEIPQDFLDAARIDGATWFRVMTSIVLPLSLPVIVTSAVLVFLAQWNSFFWPMLVAPDPNYRMVQVAVSIIGVRQQLTFWDMLFAASTIAAIVPLLLVLPLQRFYISSIMGSGVKG